MKSQPPQHHTLVCHWRDLSSSLELKLDQANSFDLLDQASLPELSRVWAWLRKFVRASA